MKNIILTITCLICLFSTPILRGQNTPAAATSKATTAAQPTPNAVKSTGAKHSIPKKHATKAKPASVSTPKAVVATDTSVVNIGSPAKVNGTGGMPVMTFDKKLYDFGNIKTGDNPTVVYTFTNTGNAPLDIDIITGCDCTELDWTRSTVQVGEKGTITATFHSKKAEEEDHKKKLEKYVDIVLKQTHPSSGYPLVESLKFYVFIVD